MLVNAQDADTSVVVTYDPMSIGIVVIVVASLAAAIVTYLRTRDAGVLTATLKELLIRKDVRDEAERRYMESSITVQQLIKLVQSGVIFVDKLNISQIDGTVELVEEFIDGITDGEINEEVD